jgi:deoxynucleoside triphosphate triphosphohydrolase SAMHD1
MPEDLDRYRDDLEKWTMRELDPYINRLARHDPPYEGPKEFNDPVWGTLQLRPDEVIILDSPLMQRLRRIRLLGVAHLTYPSATHTRLEHSLGTLHQVQQLITSVNEHHPRRDEPGADDPTPILSPRRQRLLRLAALCHDIGQAAMSHVTSESIEDIMPASDIRLQFQKKHKKPDLQPLAEITGYYILGSPAFRNLLREVDRLCLRDLMPDLPQKLPDIVIGNPVDPEVLLLHELVTGPFDADRLDYLTRNAVMCGVPIVADVPRLIQKVRAVQVDQQRLPRNLRGIAENARTAFYVTGIAHSGARSLEEVALAETLMFDKVLRHHKVRAAEVMVHIVVAKLRQLLGEDTALLPMTIYDDQIIGLTEESLSMLTGTPHQRQTGPAKRAADVAVYVAQRLRERRLFSRGAAFAGTMPGDAYHRDPYQREGLQQLIDDCSERKRRQEVEVEIAQLVSDAARLIGQDDVVEVAGNNLADFIQISPPRPLPRRGSGTTGHAYLIDGADSIMRADDEAADSPTLAEAYVTTREMGHVFTLKRLTPLVYAAVERLLLTRYQVVLPENMLSHAKIDRKEVLKVKRQLDAAGWYNGLPLHIRPMPQALLFGDATSRADEIVALLRTYAGPFDDQLVERGAPRSGAAIGREHVLHFVRQFHSPGQDDDLVGAALTVLSNIRVLGRSDVSAALRAFHGPRNPGFGAVSYCALGELKDSSSHLAYYLHDQPHPDRQLRSLPDALTRDEPIVFVDDLVGRGSQSISIVERWLDVLQTEQLNEERGQSLTTKQIELFRSHKLAFVFIAGLTGGETKLRERLSELGLDATVYVYIPEADLPRLDRAINDRALRDKFRKFCATKAREVLYDADPTVGHGDAWINERMLGYGNNELLIVSTYNTPSATLTCLWAENRKKAPWRALLPRRKKL